MGKRFLYVGEVVCVCVCVRRKAKHEWSCVRSMDDDEKKKEEPSMLGMGYAADKAVLRSSVRAAVCVNVMSNDVLELIVDYVVPTFVLINTTLRTCGRYGMCGRCPLATPSTVSIRSDVGTVPPFWLPYAHKQVKRRRRFKTRVKRSRWKVNHPTQTKAVSTISFA